MWNKKLGSSSLTLRDSFFRWLLMSASMLGAIFFISGFTYDTGKALLEAAVIFGFLNAAVNVIAAAKELQIFVEKIIFLNFLVNMLLLFLVSKIIPTFHIESSSTVVWGSILISLISRGGGYFSFFKQVAAPRKKSSASTMKQANARVIGSKKNN